MRKKNYPTRPKGVSHEEYVASCRDWAIAVHKAKRCLVGYMKDVHGRDDGMTSLAIEDFAHDKGYHIPDNKTPARWLTELFLSGEDEHISQTSIYFCHKKLYAELTEEEKDARAERKLKEELLSSPWGEEHLAFCQDVARQKGVSWVDIYIDVKMEQDRKKYRRRLTLKERYEIYLSSPEWRKFRREVMDSRGATCQRCGSNHRLQIHHITYERVFKEKPEDVEILCRDCHKKEHGIA